MNTKRPRINGRPHALGTCSTVVPVTHGLRPDGDLHSFCDLPPSKIERGTYNLQQVDCPDCKRALAPDLTPQLGLFGGAR